MRNFAASLLCFACLTSLAQIQSKLNVYFKFNQSLLESNFKSKIDSILMNPLLEQVNIAGHCDSLGNHFYNDGLSYRRSMAIKNYLISKNIDTTKISMSCLGKRVPLNKNLTEEERALNRRAELTFIFTEATRLKKPDTNLVVPTATVSINPESTPKKKDSVPDHHEINIKNIEVGGTFVLKNLNFEPGKHVLLNASKPTLVKLLQIMKDNPTLEIEIQGHVCCEGKYDDGLDFDTGTRDLSVNRAKTVYDYLVKHGIEKSRLSFKGFGASQKLVKEKTEEDKVTNRRVEIKIIKK
jgi:outer membrane protein OmpA-like peptidoglycan-associated protein